MKEQFHGRRALFVVIVGIVTAFFLSSSPAARAADTAHRDDGSQPDTLRIGFQKSLVNLTIAKQRKSIEQRLPGVRISWFEFNAGPQLLEALSVGSIDFGTTGDTPPIFAQ